MASVKELILKRVEIKLEELINNKLIDNKIANEIIETIKNGKLSNYQKIKDNLIFDNVLELYLDKSEFTPLKNNKYNGASDIIHKTIKHLQSKVKNKLAKVMEMALEGKIDLNQARKVKTKLEQFITNYRKFLKNNRDKFVTTNNKINKEVFKELTEAYIEENFTNAR